VSTAGIFPCPYCRSPDQHRATPARHRVVIVGGGPVGLALAADLGGRGVGCVVVDGKAEFGEGSRGLCYAKRTLEILDWLGVAERAVAKGVTWQLGKVFHGEKLLYQFNLLPEGGHKMPAFINLQQYYLGSFSTSAARNCRGSISASRPGAPVSAPSRTTSASSSPRLMVPMPSTPTG
jgi:3-(3-hydroxy-phenyl)propionate hydroxylase